MRVLIPDAQYPGLPDIEAEALPDAEFVVHRARDPLQIPDSVWSRADGVLLTCEPAASLPMTQRYFLF